jgi:hypothetical protein
MQAEGMGRAYCARRSKGLQRRSAEGPARGGVSGGIQRCGQDGGVVVTEAAREEGLHSMVGYVREVRGGYGYVVKLEWPQASTQARKEASSESRDRSEGRLKFIPTSSLHTRLHLHLPICNTSTSLHFIPSLLICSAPSLDTAITLC